MAYKRSYTSKYEAFVKNFTISGFAAAKLDSWIALNLIELHDFVAHAAILDSWIALDLIGLHDFVAQPYLGKVTKAFHSTPSGSETTAKKTGLWGKIIPLSPYEG